MLITTALSLFFLFWSLLFLIDFYLRTTENETYLAFVKRRGFSVLPLQVKFYVNCIENTNAYSSYSLIKTWTLATSQRAIHFIDIWFSVGAFIGLFCFVLTPIYLTCLLFVELNNVIHISKESSNSILKNFYASTSVTSTSNSLNALEQEEVNFKTAITDFTNLANSPFYIPLQEHVQSGITPVIPGVNIPRSHLPLFMIVLIIAGIFHELGHAIAAINANVRLNGFGIFLFAVYPGAFTELETDELMRSSSAQKLRIFSAGIWHNIILALIGIFFLFCAPILFFPFYQTNNGVLIIDMSERSGLYGVNGFQPGHIVTQINQCPVRNSTEWTKCLKSMHMHQQENLQQIGYLVQYSKVLPLTASPNNVKKIEENGEVQCCSEFGNLAPLSHICFRYFVENFEQINTKKIIDVNYNNNKNNISLLENQKNLALLKMFEERAKNYEKKFFYEEKSNLTTKKYLISTVLNLVELQKIQKMRVKKLKLLKTQKVSKNFVNNKKNFENNFKKNVENNIINLLNKTSTLNLIYKKKKFVAKHACLPARQITDHPTCQQFDKLKNLKKSLLDYICVTPALYNGTVLLRFELKNRSRPVLFIGFLSEPLYMVNLMNLTPRFNWIPFWFPLVFELFNKYLITFSLAMALLNAVPCYGLDGQYMCHTVVDYFFAKKSVEKRQIISKIIIIFGSVIFCLNVVIGFAKFLFNYFT